MCRDKRAGNPGHGLTSRFRDVPGWCTERVDAMCQQEDMPPVPAPASRRGCSSPGSGSGAPRCPGRGGVTGRGRDRRRDRGDHPVGLRSPYRELMNERCGRSPLVLPSRRATSATGAPGGIRREGLGTRGTVRPLPSPTASRSCAAAEHVGFDRVTQAGAALAPQLAGQRRVHRTVPRHHRQRPRDHDAADALLLRAVGDPQPPVGRRR